MFSATKTQKVPNDNTVLDFVKGLIVSCLVSLALVILFAFSLKWFALSDVFITPVILVIKGISVVIGSAIAIKGESKGLVKGVMFGLLFMLVAFVLFSILAGTFSFDLSSILDFAFAALAGGVVGIIKVNKK